MPQDICITESFDRTRSSGTAVPRLWWWARRYDGGVADETSDKRSDSEPVWTNDRLKNPHAVADKQRRVRDMFAAIAPSYDLNNRLFSFGTDQRWRKKAVKLSRLKADDVVVDVACGTGDLTLAYADGLLRAGGSPDAAHRITGIDYTFEMLPRAAAKWARSVTYGELACDDPDAHPGVDSFVRFVHGDAQNLPLPDACCDVVSIAFGIRNVGDPMRAYREFRRVLRPGGRVVVLEFSKPTNGLIRAGYNVYFNHVLTRLAALVARDRTGAYRYLASSVETFKTRGQMKADLESAGFGDVEVHPLTFGVAVIYVGFARP